MLDLFDTPWDKLDTDSVREFLRTAGDEGVTWEAKADDQRGKLHPNSLRKAACGLANRLGGYILVGAKRDHETEQWSLPGITRPDREPELWVGRVLRDLRPVPDFVPKLWTVDGDRIAGVVWVAPVNEPPCMTPQGQVYERVSSETLPVTDPARLDALFRGGQQARGRAEHFATRAAHRALDTTPWFSERAVGVAVALAPVARRTDDIGSLLFVRSFRDELEEKLRLYSLKANPMRSRYEPEDPKHVQQQDAVSMSACFIERSGPTVRSDGEYRSLGRHLYFACDLQATWDGAVAASAALSTTATKDATDYAELLRPAWEAVVPLVELLGGYGSAHLAVHIYVAPDRPNEMPFMRGGAAVGPPPAPPTGTLFAGMPEHTLVARLTTVANPDPATFDSVCRELQRAAGREANEPE